MNDNDKERRKVASALGRCRPTAARGVSGETVDLCGSPKYLAHEDAQHILPSESAWLARAARRRADG